MVRCMVVVRCSELMCAVFGEACHIGVQLDLPSVGVAKTLYHVDGIENNEEHRQKVCSCCRAAQFSR